MRRSGKRDRDDASSRPKRTRRAATRDPSTSSSTTGPRGRSGDSARDDPTLNDHSRHDPTREEAVRAANARLHNPESGRFEPFRPFDGDARDEVLKLLALGASPAAACQRTGVSPTAFARASRDDADFAAALTDVRRTLDENVAAALYRSAMEGSVSAQTQWMKQRLAASAAPDCEDAPELVDLESLSEAELRALAAAYGVAWPAEDESGA